MDASQNISPPAPLVGKALTSLALPYSILFLVGTCGNIAVLTYVFFIVRSLKSSVTALGNTFVYIVALCSVDLLVTMTIPFHLSYFVLDNWVFGEAACKLYWILELSNKMCSTFILTTLAFDRYMAICHPEVKRIHHMRQTVAIVLGMLLLSIGLILPVVYSAKLMEIPLGASYTDSRGVTRPVMKHVCTDGLKKDARVWVSGLLSFFAFFLPCTLLTYFYVRILTRLRRQIRTMLQSRIPIRRITIYTLVVTLFYLSCQIPYWMPQIYGTFLAQYHLISMQNFLTITYISHVFPFIAAAFNWIFYAQLNSQFKKGLILVTERFIRKQTSMISRHVIISPALPHTDSSPRLMCQTRSRTDDAADLVCPRCKMQLPLQPLLE